jgi:nucleoside-diphosphate-sugar epimerase
VKTSRVLVTGANGFVGQHLCAALTAQGYKVLGAVRPAADVSHLASLRGLELLPVASYDDAASYAWRLRDLDAVVHLAARVHVMREKAPDPLAEFRHVNVETTRALANAAAGAGVRRFIYVSSVKVNGESTGARPFEADDAPGFVDAYGQSKWEAEETLREVASARGMEWSVVRPPLVYGPGVRGNFLALMQLLRRGLPLPLGAVKNSRSMVNVFNLVDLLRTMIEHPDAAGQRFLVKDGEDVSTSQLVRSISAGMMRHARLVPVPTRLLVAAGRLLGRGEAIDRLCSSLVLNTEKTARELGWSAPVSFTSGIGRTCEWFNLSAPGGAL